MSCSRRFWNTKITYDISIFISKRRANCHMSYFENCVFSLLSKGLLQFFIQPSTKIFHSQLKFFLSQPKFFLTTKIFHSQPKFVTHNQNFSLTAKICHSQSKFFHTQTNFFPTQLKIFLSQLNFSHSTKFLSTFNFFLTFAINFVKRMKFSIKTLLYLKNCSYFRIAKLAIKDSENSVSGTSKS